MKKEKVEEGRIADWGEGRRLKLESGRWKK